MEQKTRELTAGAPVYGCMTEADRPKDDCCQPNDNVTFHRATSSHRLAVHPPPTVQAWLQYARADADEDIALARFVLNVGQHRFMTGWNWTSEWKQLWADGLSGYGPMGLAEGRSLRRTPHGYRFSSPPPAPLPVPRSGMPHDVLEAANRGEVPPLTWCECLDGDCVAGSVWVERRALEREVDAALERMRRHLAGADGVLPPEVVDEEVAAAADDENANAAVEAAAAAAPAPVGG